MWDFEDNSGIIFSYFSSKTYAVSPHYSRLGKTAVKRGHNIFFYGKMWKLSLSPLVIWSTDLS